MAVPPAEHVIVDCPAGRLRGNRRLNGAVHEFLGVTFAKAPVGQLRYARPQSLPGPSSPGETLDATRRGPAPWQTLESDFEDDREACWIPEMPRDEACLDLNLWAPSGGGGRLLPVLVWLYGGGFSCGAAGLPLYDGAVLALHSGAVVVTANYRVGPLGFLFAPEHGCRGNMGLWDQRAALAWLQDNLSAFGGDPAQVTLFGESAGAVSVALHMLSPPSWPLFHRAVLQSGAPTNPWAVLPLAEAARRSGELLEAAGGWSGALTTSPERLVELGAGPDGVCQFRFTPTVDGEFLAGEPGALLRRGAFKRCPVMVGTNTAESSFYVLAALGTERCGDPANFETFESFREAVAEVVPHLPRYPRATSAAQVMAMAHEYFPWPGGDGEVARQALVDLASDFHFAIDVYLWLREMARAEDAPPLFAYSFERTPDLEERWPAWTGAKHGDEIAFVFGDPLRECPTAAYSEREATLAVQVMRLWATFASSSQEDLCSFGMKIDKMEWKPWTERKKSVMRILSEKISLESNYDRGRQCHFWKEVIPKLDID